MYPALIEEYLTPTTVDEALDALRRRPRETRVIAGGMSLMQLMKARQAEPACLVDLRKVASLREIRIDGAGVRIGAMVRYKELVADARLHGAFGGLGDAARTIGDRQVRSEDEILTAVLLPPAAPRSGSAYLKYGFTVDGPPVLGVAAAVRLGADGRCAVAALAVGGVLPRCRRAPQAERALVGHSARDQAALAAALETAAQEVDTHADLWADGAYRKVLLRQLGGQAVAQAFGRAAGGA